MSNIDVLGFPNWDEIVGEQVRGGQSNADYNNYLMGANVDPTGNPAFNQTVSRAAALQRPMLRSMRPTVAQEWQIGLTQYSATAQTVTVTVVPQCYFRAEKFMAVELLLNGQIANPAITTVVTGAFIGQKNQLPVGAGAGGSLHAAFFGIGALGNGIKWSTCQPAITIGIQVQFLTANVTWYGALFGKAVLN